MRLAGDGNPGTYDVTVRRLRTRGGGAPHVLVSFEGVEQTQEVTRPAPTAIALDQVSRQQLGTLEGELSRTKENLQAAIEELETSNEEVQASNEELQASNEELQSTN